MRAYLYLMKTKLLITLAYRFDVLTTFAIQAISLIAVVCFWKAAYGGGGMIAGTTERQMIDYTILSLFLSAVYSIGVESYVYQSIRDGSIASDYIKPVNLMGMYFAMDIGAIVSNLLLKFLPAFLFAIVLFGVPIPASPLALVLFFISTGFGFLLMWLLSAICSLLTFWLIEFGAFMGVKDHIVKFLSGSMIPMWFFPAGVYRVLQCLPFLYIYQMPLSIYIGRASIQEALVSLVVQAVWVLLLLALFYAVHRKAFRRLVVQGG